MTLAQAYPKILDEYLEIAKSLSGKGKRILKTDLFNEVRNLPIDGGIIKNIDGDVEAIEIRKEYVKIARKQGVAARTGDIRYLPFNDKSFDVVMDFSTIDHIVEFEKVISEYARVLKPGGKLGMVYWTKEYFATVNDGNEFFQVYFVRDEILLELDEYFECERDWELFIDEKNKRELVGFIGRRK